MKQRSGFTLIEVLVTITIMVILMTLAVVNVRNTQVRARDSDRKSDVESIARQLDSLYTTGYSFPYGGSTVQFKGHYPTTSEFLDPAARAAMFEGLPAGILVDPTMTTSANSLGVAVNEHEGIDQGDTSTLVNPTPGTDPSTKPYIYQPIDDNDNICTVDTGASAQNCRRFNLFYRTEYDNKIYVVKSRYQ